jgi:hypothetical protein
MGVLPQNLNIGELVKFLEKKSKTSHSNQSDYIEDDIIQNHEKSKKWKKVKIQDSMCKTNFFFGTLPFDPWAILGVPKQILKKWI